MPDEHENAMVHVISALRGAEIITNPYPHFVVQNIFPDKFYNKMLDMLPVGSAYRNWTDVGRVRNPKYQNRQQWYLEDEWMEDINEPCRSFWLEFGKWFLDSQIARETMNLFRNTLSSRFETTNNQWPAVYPQAIFLRHTPGYALGPHTDMPSKVVNLLFYLPPNDEVEGIGTAIYKPKVPGLTDPGMSHFDRSDFEVEKIIAYRPNSVFGFVKTNHSWHGVEPFAQEQGELTRRDVLQYMVYDNEMRAPRKPLNKVSQKADL